MLEVLIIYRKVIMSGEARRPPSRAPNLVQPISGTGRMSDQLANCPKCGEKVLVNSNPLTGKVHDYELNGKYVHVCKKKKGKKKKSP